MSYQKMTIRKVIEMIGSNEIYLPAIQRKFVWKHDQIEMLFDSIMRDFPIGTFLFWTLNGEKINDYTFYKFLNNYHQKTNYLNEIAPKPELKDSIIGILDGQQRLSSMYIALQGTYAYKLPHYRFNSEHAFPTRKFYLNLFSVKENTDGGEVAYEFKFLTDKEASKCDENNLWFEAKNVLKWQKASEVNKFFREMLAMHEGDDSYNIIESRQDTIDDILTDLWDKFTKTEIINYYNLVEEDLDNILDIFVRVNSGGTVLSKSDLLFSTIVANWQEGREEIDGLLTSINNKGDCFNFDIDFIMRSCLVLTDCPVLFKLGNFKQENIHRIKNEWENIKASIDSTVDLLVEFGFSGSTITSQIAVIPIAYYLIQGGQLNDSTKRALRDFLIYGYLKQVYGNQGDRVLAAVRDRMREESSPGMFTLRNIEFDFTEYVDMRLPNGRAFSIAEEDIEEMLEYKKGAYAFMVLSLLYPHLKLDRVKFHQDHIHPDSLFKPSKLRKAEIPEEKWSRFQERKDRLPNLQLLEGRENVMKSATPFVEWLENADIPDKDKFLLDNYIPSDIPLEFSNFEKFYELREQSIREKLKRILHIQQY